MATINEKILCSTRPIDMDWTTVNMISDQMAYSAVVLARDEERRKAIDAFKEFICPRECPEDCEYCKRLNLFKGKLLQNEK
jgi:inhibitor of KinA sporulation pathway (predicted exonuclease)